jgi:hypothetical protein
MSAVTTAQLSRSDDPLTTDIGPAEIERRFQAALAEIKRQNRYRLDPDARRGNPTGDFTLRGTPLRDRL